MDYDRDFFGPADVHFEHAAIGCDDLKGGSFETLKAAKDAGAVTLNVGLFINAIISFVIVVFALFMLIKAVNTLNKEEEEAPAEPEEPPRDVQLLEEIRDALVKKK